MRALRKSLMLVMWLLAVGIKPCPGQTIIGTSTQGDFFGRGAGTAWGNKRSIVLDSACNIHCIWDGGADIFYTVSTDDGANWSIPVNISNTPCDDESPSISVGPGDTIHVIWSDDSDILHRKCDGTSWYPIDTVSALPNNEFSAAHCYDRFGKMHIVWVEQIAGLLGNIRYAFSEGFGWSQSILIFENGSQANFPTVVADTVGNIYIFWNMSVFGCKNDVFGRYYDKNSDTWSDIFNVSRSPTKQSRCASALIDKNNNPCVVWDEDEASGDVYYNVYFSEFDGSNWSEPINVSNQTNCKAIWGNITSDTTGNICVFYMSNYSGSYEIYLKKRVSGLWQENQNISQTSQYSGYASVILQIKNKLHLLWTEGDTRPYNIIYRNLPLSSIYEEEGGSEGNLYFQIGPNIIKRGIAGGILKVRSLNSLNIRMYNNQGELISTGMFRGGNHEIRLSSFLGQKQISSGVYFIVLRELSQNPVTRVARLIIL